MAPGIGSRLLSLSAVLCSSGALAGCGSETEAHPDHASAPGAGGDVILLRGGGMQLTPGTRDNFSLRDPAVDGWPSEVLHDRAKEVLSAFMKIVCGDEPWDEAHERAVLAASFRGASALRPAQLAVVHEDRSARVSRPASVERALREPDELRALCAEMVRPFDGEKCRWFTKITRVDLEGAERFHTSTLVHTDGASDGGLLQQNMEWRIGWAVLPLDAGVRIEAIELEHYEEFWLPQTPFAEIESAVFGANRSFGEELLRGVDQYHKSTDRLLGGPFLGMQGIAAGDVNGDGLDDVFLGQPAGVPNRLYLHQSDGTALDATVASHTGILESTRGVLLIDADNDGDQDLLMGIGHGLVKAENDGKGVFGDFQVRLAETRGDLYSLSAADPDRDGDLDVYACRYFDEGIMFGVPTPYHDADNGNPNLYYRNDGDGYTIATAAVGLDANNRKFSLASIWDDFDADGDVDLFVANDFGRDNLYRNEGGRFTDVAREVGADDIGAGMGASVADYDLDGDPDLYITNMFSSAGRRIATQSDRFMDGEHAEVHGHYERHARGNTLLANRGDGTFEDVTDAAGVAIGGWGWGARFVDYNNDGLPDIFGPCGFVTGAEKEDL